MRFLAVQKTTRGGAGWGGGGVNVGHPLSPPPQSFYACYGPVVFWSDSRDCLIQ